MSDFLYGTCGWSYDHWGGDVFYPSGLRPADRLACYASRFPAVEIDSTFYRLPREGTAAKWADAVPPDFRFAVKGSRLITHLKRLAECREALEAFATRTRGLGDKLDVLLWQLPPTMPADPGRLDSFCRLLGEAMPGRHAFEFRHEGWFDETTYRILRGHGHGLVVAHSRRWPTAEVVTADFVYLRFHGGEEREDSAYSGLELAAWAAKARAWMEKDLDVYAFFNNDEAGYAPRDSANLARLVASG